MWGVIECFLFGRGLSAGHALPFGVPGAFNGKLSDKGYPR